MIIIAGFNYLKSYHIMNYIETFFCN